MIKKLFYKIVMILAIVAIFVPLPVDSAQKRIVNVHGERCTQGLTPLQDSPYAIMMFCEDALGNYLSITYFRSMGAPVDGAWSLNNRHWQNEPWGLDVTSYYYVPAISALFISTSEHYGEGGIFRLDLHTRKFRKLTSDTAKEGKVFQFKSVDNQRHRLNYEVTLDGRVKKIASIPLK